MHLLDQTLSSEKQRVLAQATQDGDDFLRQWAPIPVAPENDGINVPIRKEAQAVPLADPYWNQNGEEDEWCWRHFIHLIVEGLKRVKIKPLNYYQVIVV
jgi:hypothetical protein